MGVFTVCAAGPEHFDEQELAHLRDIAASLSGALAKLRKEEAQRQAERDTQILAAIVASSDDAIFTHTLDGTISSWNPAAERIFGYSVDEIIGQPISITIPPNQIAMEAEARSRLAKGELAAGIETVRRRKGGALFPASLTISYLKAKDGTLVGFSKIVRDDTERNQARKELSDLQSAYSTVVQNLKEGVFVYRIEGDRLEWNPAAFQILGVTREEVANLSLAELDSWFQILDADGAFVPHSEWPLSRVIRGETLRNLELSVRTVGTDRTRRFSFSGAKAVSGEGASIAFITAEDVTERKRSEQALLEASKFSEQILMGAGEGILVLDQDLRYRVLNPVMERLIGLRAHDVLGHSVQDILPPSITDGLMPRLKRALRGEVVRSDDTYVPASQTSPARWICTKDAPLRNANGEITGVIMVVTDVTHRKITEEALNRTIAELYNAQRIARIGSWEWDVAQDRLTWSTHLLVIFGISKDDFGGNYEHLVDRILPVDRPAMEAATEAALRGEAKINVELRVVMPDGSVKWLHIMGDFAQNDAGSVSRISGSALDVTSRRLAEDALRELKAVLEVKVAERTAELQIARVQAESADRMKSAFLATMSHELRTPLNSIIGFTGILVQRLAGPLNEEQHKQLQTVQISARHLLKLINDVLDISKIEAGQFEVHVEEFDLLASIDKVINMMKPIAEKKKIDLELALAPEIAIVNSDQHRVEQILVNLLSNAIKFTEYGRVSVMVENPAYRLLPAEFVQIRVEDTGIGIHQENLEAIFEPFRQIDSGLTRKHEGTGLGLAISRRLTDRLKGRISVESEFGRGSVFTVTLPSRLVQEKLS